MMKRLRTYFPWLIILSWVGWLLAVLAAGVGFDLFGDQDFNFDLPAKFGDAFGSLNGFMASLAAAGAWYAVHLQRVALESQTSAREEDDKVRRQLAFEQNFFQLLSHLAAIVRETDVVRTSFGRGEIRSSTVEGRDAYNKILAALRGRIEQRYGKEGFDPKAAYLDFYRDYQDELSHYFRVLYHVCNYIYINKDVDRSFYMKFVFGQLSNSELILLAYNCAYGFGERKFKPIVEEFKALTNIGFTSREPFEEPLIRAGLSPEALPPIQS